MEANAVARAKTPMSVMVISIIEITLGLLAIGLVLESQANSFNPAPIYLSIFAYASAGLLAVALTLLAAGLLAVPAIRLSRLTGATVVLASAAFVMTAGYAILTQVSTWTTPVTCDGCVGLNQAPTVNQVVASVVFDVGGGALAALLPIVALALLRHRRESATAAGTDGSVTDGLKPASAPLPETVREA